MAKRPLCLALLALSLVARPSVAGDWPQYQHDPAHTGYTPSTLDPRRLAYQWTSPAGYGAPLIRGDTAYSSSRTAVTAFDLATGRQRWSTPINSPGQLAIVDDTVVTTSYPYFTNKSVQVLDAATGSLRYAVQFGRNNASPGVPVVYQKGGATHVLVMEDSSLFSIRLNAGSGSVNWSTLAGYVSGLPPTVAEDAAIVSSYSGAVAVDLATGARSEPFFVGTNSSADGFLTAYDASRRRMYFVNSLSAERPSVLAAYDYVDGQHATLAWTRDLAEMGMDPAVGPDGKVYITDRTTLYEVDPETGRTLRSLPGQQFAYGSAPLISNGYLYDVSETGQVIYDLESFSLATTLPGSRMSMNTVLRSTGALTDEYFAYQASPNSEFVTFAVYRAVPEPSGLMALGAGAGLVVLRRRNGARR